MIEIVVDVAVVVILLLLYPPASRLHRPLSLHPRRSIGLTGRFRFRKAARADLGSAGSARAWDSAWPASRGGGLMGRVGPWLGLERLGGGKEYE
jgi:hypothetical protein